MMMAVEVESFSNVVTKRNHEINTERMREDVYLFNLSRPFYKINSITFFVIDIIELQLYFLKISISN